MDVCEWYYEFCYDHFIFVKDARLIIFEYLLDTFFYRMGSAFDPVHEGAATEDPGTLPG